MFTNFSNQCLRGSFGFILIFTCVSAFAQVTDSTDYFPPPPGESNSAVSSVLRSQKHLVFFDVTQNTWLNTPKGVTTKFISGGFNFSLYYDFFIAKKFFGIAPGISFSNATVKNNSSLYFFYDNNSHVDSVVLHPESGDSLKRKISVNYLDIPVEFRFRIKPDDRGKNFWFAPGFRAGILLSDFEKVKGKNSDGNDYKFKWYNIPFIQKYHYGITLRAGYYKFGIYAFYSLSSLFEKDKGPEVVPFSVGVSLTPL